jgi:hypothetical protein
VFDPLEEKTAIQGVDIIVPIVVLLLHASTQIVFCGLANAVFRVAGMTFPQNIFDLITVIHS